MIPNLCIALGVWIESTIGRSSSNGWACIMGISFSIAGPCIQDETVILAVLYLAFQRSIVAKEDLQRRSAYPVPRHLVGVLGQNLI